MLDDLAPIGEVAASFASAPWHEVEGLAIGALGDVARRLGADRAYVTVFHDDGTFRNLFEWTSSGVLPQLPVIQELRSDDFPHTSRLARAGGTFAVPDLERAPESAEAERRSFSSFGVRAVLQVPIVVDGVGIGLVGLNHYAPVEGWPDHDVALVDELCRAICIAVVRERADHVARRSAEALADARRARNELLAHVSHELRTPLHGLLGYTELLGFGLERDEDRRALGMIETSGRRLLSMVDDLIDLAEASGDRVRDVELAPMVASAVGALRAVADQRAAVLEIDASVDGVTVRSEPGRVRQVLHCAVSGALQAIEHGGAVVIGALAADGAPAVVTLAVDVAHPVLRPDTIMPLARTLVEGHGTIDLDERAGGFDVRIAFDPSPTA